MAAFTATQSGNWNDNATWGGGGYPNSLTDTATIGAYTITIPTATSISCGAIGLTGTGTSTRSKLIVNGSLQMGAALTLNEWNELQVNGGATLDLNGYDLLLTSHVTNHNRLYFIGSSGNRSRVKSSSTLSTIWRTAGNIYCHVDWQYCDFEKIGGGQQTSGGYTLGGNFNYTAGEIINVQRCSFTACGQIKLGGSLHQNASLIFEYNDVVDNASATGFGVYLQDNNTSTAGTGTFRVANNTFASTTGSIGPAFRTDCARLPYIDDCVFVDVKHQLSSTLSQTTSVRNNVLVMQAAIGQAVTQGTSGYYIANYILSRNNNPHPIENASKGVSYCVFESTYSVGTINDGGDHWMIPSTLGTATFEYNLLLEKRNGTILNCVQGAYAGTFTHRHNTSVQWAADNGYGALLSEEGAGQWNAGSIATIHSNLACNLGPTSTSHGLHFIKAVNDSITHMNNNNYYNYASKYYGVASATKTAGVTAGWGDLDTSVNPNFVDTTRGVATYNASIGGAGTEDAFVADMQKINGYDSATKTQIPANAHSRRAADVIAWVKAGFVPTNEALRNAGYDGITVGAVEMLPALSILTVGSPINDTSINNSLTLSNSVTLTDIKLRSTSGGYNKSVIFNGSGTSWTFSGLDVAGIVAQSYSSGIPFDSTYWDNEIYVTDGVGSDTNPISVIPNSGWAVVDVGTNASNATGSIFEGWITPPAQYSQILYETADNTTISDTGIITTDKTSGQIKVVVWDIADGNWSAFYVVLSSSGGELIRNIVTIPITSESIQLIPIELNLI